MDRSATARCPKCREHWPVFGSANPLPVAIADNTIEISEGALVEEPYRDVKRDLDNRRGTTATTQTITVSQQWTQTLQFDGERARTSSVKGGLNAHLVSIEAKADHALRTKYALTTTHQQTYSDEIKIEVPPLTRRVLLLHYKRLWQTGSVRVPVDGVIVEIPFRVAVSMTLDWSQHDDDE